LIFEDEPIMAVDLEAVEDLGRHVVEVVHARVQAAAPAAAIKILAGATRAVVFIKTHPVRCPSRPALFFDRKARAAA